jgi:hypothetical protein
MFLVVESCKRVFVLLILTSLLLINLGPAQTTPLIDKARTGFQHGASSRSTARGRSDRPDRFIARTWNGISELTDRLEKENQASAATSSTPQKKGADGHGPCCPRFLVLLVLKSCDRRLYDAVQGTTRTSWPGSNGRPPKQLPEHGCRSPSRPNRGVKVGACPWRSAAAGLVGKITKV